MQILKDIILLAMLVVVLLMVATAIVNLFLVQVPYVPTRKALVKHLSNQLKIKKNSKFYDLGCGDGRMLIEIEKNFKANCEGFEIAPIPYLLAKFKSYLYHSKAKIKFKNFFQTDLSDADFIFCYLTPEILDKLLTKLKAECKKGTKIITHTFQFQNLQPEKIIQKNPQTKTPNIYFYEI